METLLDPPEIIASLTLSFRHRTVPPVLQKNPHQKIQRKYSLWLWYQTQQVSCATQPLNMSFVFDRDGARMISCFDFTEFVGRTQGGKHMLFFLRFLGGFFNFAKFEGVLWCCFFLHFVVFFYWRFPEFWNFFKSNKSTF